MRGDELASRVTPSLLERLIDQNPGAPDSLETRTLTPAQFADIVLQDLETLLNTRNPYADLAREFDDIRQSVIAYGIPDLTGIPLGVRKQSESQTAGANKLRGLLETAIRRFEPRLSKVSVSLATVDRALVLHVDASLQIEPSPEAVAFDVMVSLDTRNCRVSGID